jgi:hypothetical protein
MVDRPGHRQQLAKVLAEEGAAELVLCGPGGVHGCLRTGVSADVGLCQRWDYEHPAQKPGQREDHRGGADPSSSAHHGVLSPPQSRRKKQDGHSQDGVRPRRGEPGPDQARATGDETW